MLPMVGGQTARGENMLNVFIEGGPSEPIMPTQESNQGSQTGSSDDPEDSVRGHGTNETVQQPRAARRSSQRNSGGSFPDSENSGSKRKSTDDSFEERTRGMRCKEAIKKSKKEKELMAQAGFQIANSLEASAQLKKESLGLKKEAMEQFERCLARINDLGLTGEAEDFCMKELEKPQRRIWMLKSDDAAIFQWLNRNNIFHNREHSTSHPNSFSAMFHHNSAPTQYHYPPTTPDMNNYNYPPNGPAR